MKQLLIDHISTIQVPKQKLIESFNTLNGRMIVSGVVQRADVPNQNGRVYPRRVLERELNKYQQKIEGKSAFGELDHADANVVNMKNVSHHFTELWWQGNDMMGKVEIFDTPCGRILKEIISAGCTVGISSRGMGSVQSINEGEDGEFVEVLDDFELLCWDFVSDPSTHQAYMYPVSESKGSKTNMITESKYQKANQLISDLICELSGVCCLKNQ